jgi:hypothetical protein
MFIQPSGSATKWRTPSGDQRGWLIQSVRLPATIRDGPSEPSASTGARCSSVPSQGMFGWCHSIQTSVVPSGESRGAA